MEHLVFRVSTSFWGLLAFEGRNAYEEENLCN